MTNEFEKDMELIRKNSANDILKLDCLIEDALYDKHINGKDLEQLNKLFLKIDNETIINSCNREIVNELLELLTLDTISDYGGTEVFTSKETHQILLKKEKLEILLYNYEKVEG